ncbi:hypothetical protein HK096_009229, partial [Nowakowskiella sp. JEL0078]
MTDIWRIYILISPKTGGEKTKSDSRRMLLDVPKSLLITLLNVVKRFRNIEQRLERTKKVLRDFREIGVDVGIHGFHALMLAERDRAGAAERVKLLLDEMLSVTTPVQQSFDLLLDAISRDLGPWAAEKWLESALKNGVELAKQEVLSENSLPVDLTQKLKEISIISSEKRETYIKDNSNTTISKDFKEVHCEPKDTSRMKSSISQYFPGTVTFNILMKSHCDHGSIKRAKELFNQMRDIGLVPNIHTWSILIDGSAVSGDMEGMMECFRQMQDEGYQPNQIIYETMIYAYLNRALEILDVIESDELANSENNTKLNFRQKSFLGRLGEALEIYNLMQSKGIKPGVFSYSIFMMAFLRQSDYDRVETLFNDLTSKNISYDNSILNILMRSRFQAGNKAGAMEIFSHMLADKGGYEPDLFSFAICIEGHIRLGNLSEALRIFSLMKESNVEPEFVTLNILLHGFCSKGDIEKAKEVWLDLEKSFSPTVITYNTLIYGYAMARDMKGARKVFDQMSSEASWEKHVERAGDRGSIEWKNLQIQKTQRRNQQMIRCHSSKTSIEPNLETYNTLIAGFGRIHDFAGMERWYAAMIDAGIEPDVVTFNLLIHAKGRTVDTEGISNIFQLMMAKNLRPNLSTFIPLMRCFAQAGDFGKAEMIQKAMIETIKSKKEVIKSRSSTDTAILPYNILLLAFSAKGKIDSAEQQFFKANENGVAPNVRTYDMLIRAFGKLGDIENAKKWFNLALADKRIKPDRLLFKSLIFAFEKVSNVQAAENTMV